MKFNFLHKLTVCCLVFIFHSCSTNSHLKKSDVLNSSEPQVRVRIINTLDTIQIRFSDIWTGYADVQTELKFAQDDHINITLSGNQIQVDKNGRSEVINCDSLRLIGRIKTSELQIKNVPYGIGWWWAGQEDRTYEGVISIYVSDKGKPEVVINLPLEDYLCGVVPYEIGGDSPPEALTAQAVAARSEAIIALTSNLYNGKHHDLTSDVECQVFSGNNKRTSRSDRAVLETAGMILTNDGQPINAYYASNCGGHSELITNVWPDRPAPKTYLNAGKDDDKRKNLNLDKEENVRDWIFSEPDVFCNPNLGAQLPNWSQKNFRWQKKFNRDALTKMIASERDFGPLRQITALKRGSSGRMIRARFIFDRDSIDVTGELAIRQMWHPALRSACFVVDQEGDDFILNGAGWGHGVGMCQSGAVAQALAGLDFTTILKHYYHNVEISSVY